MGLRWNKGQTEIYNLLRDGLSNRDVAAKGYSWELVKKVKKAMNKGDAPGQLSQHDRETTPGQPLLSATIKTTRITLDPIVAVRYDSMRHLMGVGDEYTLEQFIDEATELVTELAGAAPPGFTRE